MKTKLLKKVRRKAYIEERNGQYRVVKKGGIIDVKVETMWYDSLNEARTVLRDIIKGELYSKYKLGKKRIT